MKLGAYTACLHAQPVGEALQTLAGLGLDSAEINSGGFLPPVHLPVDDIRTSQDARDEYLGLFSSAGVTLTALNCGPGMYSVHSCPCTPRTCATRSSWPRCWG